MSRPPQAPINFKTVPGRNRTQKWQQAKTHNYDGDDWGGFDPYDEYGGYDEPPLNAPSQSSGGPYPAPPRQAVRKNSFQQGDERRQFSAGAAFPPYEREGHRTAGPGPLPHERDAVRNRSGSRQGRPSMESRSRSRPRDFTNPDQVPPPLLTEKFPPRKSSMSRGTSPMQQPPADAPSEPQVTDKPLPFIRPSDIYKRMQEERQRQSEDGSRPSMDSLQRDPENTGGRSPMSPGSRANLETVAESRESRMFMDASGPSVTAGPTPSYHDGPHDRSEAPESSAQPSSRLGLLSDTSPTLPLLSRFSGFGKDLFGDTDSAKNLLADDDMNTSTPVAPPANVGPTTASSSLQATPTNSQAPKNFELASSHEPSKPSGVTLQHQPSAGFRSAVHQAFDHSENGMPSRDGSRSTAAGSGVGRSDTTSTSGISPIMSGVPPTATADRVLPIAEESQPSRPFPVTQRQILRKPSPSHSRNTSDTTSHNAGDIAAFEPGYRRSLEPPSSSSSPARTPALEDTMNRRLSAPMMAETVADDPDVPDQAAEIPAANLGPAATPSGGIGQPLPISGRSSSVVTDYSLREADLAKAISSSPEKDAVSPGVAEAERATREMFLESHSTNPASPAANSRPTTASGRISPNKGRVREMADQIQERDMASRRNSGTSSRSSWSNFRSSDENLQQKAAAQARNAPKTGDSEDMFPQYRNSYQQHAAASIAAPPPLRPDSTREQSFIATVPGGWIASGAPTPALDPIAGMDATMAEHTSPLTSRAADEEIDLTPTTKKVPLKEIPTASTSAIVNPFEAAKNAGSELGAALLSSVGLGHQTRDFASKEPPVPVNQPEMQTKPARGMVDLPAPLLRQETEDSAAPTSVASSIPPSPLPKDTPTAVPHGIAGRDRPSSGYFSPPVAPLRVRSADDKTQSVEHAPESASRPRMLPMLSAAASTDDFESDRLRREIVQSLGPNVDHDDFAQPQIASDALDAEPTSGQNVPTEPPPESSSTLSPSRSDYLSQRFSWESRDTSARSLAERTLDEPSPEIKPEREYERPRGSILQVVNANPDVESPMTDGASPLPVVQEPVSPVVDGSRDLPKDVTGESSHIPPIDKSQENLHLPVNNAHSASPNQSMTELTPSHLSESFEDASSRLPSYYLAEHPDEEGANALEIPKSEVPTSPSAPSHSVDSPTSPSAKKTAPPPPFRNILAMKSTQERIETYNNTRTQFADMNTGLSDWLSGMLTKHPEHRIDLETFRPAPAALQMSSLGTLKRGGGHKSSPSIVKFKGFGGESSDVLEQKGKDFMKSAGALSGKAQAGAKGLFAKGRSRFGGAGGGSKSEK